MGKCKWAKSIILYLRTLQIHYFILVLFLDKNSAFSRVQCNNQTTMISKFYTRFKPLWKHAECHKFYICIYSVSKQFQDFRCKYLKLIQIDRELWRRFLILFSSAVFEASRSIDIKNLF